MICNIDVCPLNPKNLICCMHCKNKAECKEACKEENKACKFNQKGRNGIAAATELDNNANLRKLQIDGQAVYDIDTGNTVANVDEIEVKELNKIINQETIRS